MSGLNVWKVEKSLWGMCGGDEPECLPPLPWQLNQRHCELLLMGYVFMPQK